MGPGVFLWEKACIMSKHRSRGTPFKPQYIVHANSDDHARIEESMQRAYDRCTVAPAAQRRVLRAYVTARRAIVNARSERNSRRAHKKLVHTLPSMPRANLGGMLESDQRTPRSWRGAPPAHAHRPGPFHPTERSEPRIAKAGLLPVIENDR